MTPPSFCSHPPEVQPLQPFHPALYPLISGFRTSQGFLASHAHHPQPGRPTTHTVSAIANEGKAHGVILSHRDAALQAAVPSQSGVYRLHCIGNCGAAPTRAPIAREVACVVAQQESQDRDQQHGHDAEAGLGLRLESSSQ